MFRMKKLLLVCIVSIFVVSFLFNTAIAQTDWSKYPERDITVVLDFSPGGGSDTLAQAVHPCLSEYLDASLINVYKPGANAAVGLTYWV